MAHILIKKLIFFLFLAFSLHSSATSKTIILYTANINGSIQNCKCGTNPLGGVDRLVSFIDQFRKDHSETILIDGGDFFNSYPFPQLNSVMLRTIPLLKYDIMVPGENLYMEPGLFADQFSLQLQNRLLISNNKNSATKYSLFQIQGWNIYVWSYLAPEVFKYSDKPTDLTLGKFTIPKDFKKTAKDLHILIYHGVFEGLAGLLGENPEIDLVLSAHDQQKGTIDLEGRQVICTGRDAEVVAIIEFDLNPDKYSFSTEYQDINLKLPASPEVDELIARYKSQIKIAGQK